MECYMYCKQWRRLSFQTGGSKTYIPKDFYKTGGSKTYIPKNFFMKAKYSPLLSEKFGGSTVPSHPIEVIRSIISHYIYFFFAPVTVRSGSSIPIRPKQYTGP
ncbi:hypothetical protein Hanom_Chr16g01516591 [Helianthus anomalus]